MDLDNSRSIFLFTLAQDFILCYYMPVGPVPVGPVPVDPVPAGPRVGQF